MKNCECCGSLRDGGHPRYCRLCTELLETEQGPVLAEKAVAIARAAEDVMQEDVFARLRRL